MTFYTLQLLRFIASLLVLFFHLNMVRSGYKGVDLFFVISGFVIYYTLFCKARPKAIGFIVNRFTKIFFLYWVALVLLYLIKPFTIDISVFKTLLLIPGHNSVIGVSWSLSYELYFYCLTAIVVYLIAHRYHKPLFIFAVSISSIITVINLSAFSLKGSFANFLLGPNSWEFLLGIGCAYISTSYYKLVNSNVAFVMALLSGTLLLSINIPYNTPISYGVYGILSSSTVLFLTAFEKQKPINWKAAWLCNILGESSYAIYLLGPIITIVVAADDNRSKALIIGTTVCCSLAFNQLIEKNFLIWSRRKLTPIRYLRSY